MGKREDIAHKPAALSHPGEGPYDRTMVHRVSFGSTADREEGAMDDIEERRQRRRLLAALDNVRESYDMLRESFDAEVCIDLVEWLRVSQSELEAWLSTGEASRRLH